MIPTRARIFGFLRRAAPLLALSGALLLRGDWTKLPNAHACAMPYSDPLTRFRPLSGFTSDWTNESETLLGVSEEVNFEYPFVLQYGAKAQELLAWDTANSSSNAPSRAALDAAISSGNSASIRSEAQQIVKDILDRPADRATPHRDLLFEAARLTEAKQTPAIKELTAAIDLSIREIPDGYLEAIRQNVAASTWNQLHQTVDEWLLRYPNHSIRDYAELWKVHLYYLSGATDDAWELLFRIAPHRPLRVAAEMRFLSLTSEPPAHLLNQAKTAVFSSALVGRLAWSEDRWNQLWTIAERDLTQPWAMNLQERLLFELAVAPATQALPEQFPREVKKRSQLWGKARAMTLMKRERWKEAAYQLYRLEPSQSQAGLMLRYHMHNQNPELAVRALQLDHASREFLLQVYLSEAQLLTLTFHPREELRHDAQLALAARKLAQGNWQAAANLIPAKHSEEKRQLTEAASLAKDSSAEGRLRFARFLHGHEKAMLTPDNDWYRTLSGADSQTFSNKWEKPIVTAGIERQLLAAFPNWHALKIYVAWLTENSADPSALQVLREADQAYSHLDYSGGGQYYFWTSFLKTSPVVARLREVGKTIRSQAKTN